MKKFCKRNQKFNYIREIHLLKNQRSTLSKKFYKLEYEIKNIGKELKSHLKNIEYIVEAEENWRTEYNTNKEQLEKDIKWCNFTSEKRK